MQNEMRNLSFLVELFCFCFFVVVVVVLFCFVQFLEDWMLVVILVSDSCHLKF